MKHIENTINDLTVRFFENEKKLKLCVRSANEKSVRKVKYLIMDPPEKNKIKKLIEMVIRWDSRKFFYKLFC